jgi:GntR family transcriptional regulator/MocR family aminotransferase
MSKKRTNAKTKPRAPDSRRRASVMRAGAAPVMIALERRTNMPLQRQIYSAIRRAILGRQLPPGTRLPASRTLAGDLAVSRTTVVLAYESLLTEGYITGRGSAGSFVASLDVHDANPRAAKHATPDARIESLTHSAQELARRARGSAQVRAAPTAFRTGEPALDLFPSRLWARLYARRARRSGGALLGYGMEAGHRPLRTAIAAYVSAARGVSTSADHVILVRGTQQGVHLATRVLLRPGDSAWVEDPGYPAARTLIGASGATVVPVPVDREGLLVSEGVRRAPRARVAHVSPSHQFPLGATMSLTRRLALLEWAKTAGAWILEDDYDSEFRYVGAPIPSLQGLDTSDRVIYLGTFSKTVFPALRLGYLIVPPALVDVFRATQALTDRLAPSIEHATLAEFIDDGHFTRHVRQMRAVYAERQEVLLRGIARELTHDVRATPAETGMHTIAWLSDETIRDARVSEVALAAGVEAGALSNYCVAAPLAPALLLGFAAVSPEEMRPALRALRRAIADVAMTRR